MKGLLSRQELADKLNVPLTIIEKYIKEGMQAVPGTDLFSWYQVKKFIQRRIQHETIEG
ncbi:MAG: hypothetical protein JXB49_26095 [Bacteroidales bacterium]|nr:hypothetical protein [Bacteroidales bacterium]